MSKDYPEITARISTNIKTLRKDIPDTMAGFSAMAQAATKDGVLDKKTKELIALAIGVATRCDGCIGFHTEALIPACMRWSCASRPNRRCAGGSWKSPASARSPP
jgi:alkylhydroperoxidase/carboxymuconolactone decarboxylase family protein YurZ